MMFSPFDQSPEEARRSTLPSAQIVVDRDSIMPMRSNDVRKLMNERFRSSSAS